MSSLDLGGILDLLEEATSNNLVLSSFNNELKLKYPKGNKPNPTLINRLITHKLQIIEYLNSVQDNQSPILGNADLSFEGEDYFQVTPTQEYWVNDEIDTLYKSKESTHGIIHLIFEVRGDLNIVNFKKAVSLIVHRHESLRSTFHKIEKKYFLKVSTDNAKYDLETIDLIGQRIPEKYLETLMRFNDKSFYLDQGPLFLSRILKLEEKKNIIAIKLHHVIHDTWSQEVLTTELLYAYKCLCQNNLPIFEPLSFQFKDFLGHISKYNSENRNSHRNYWVFSCPEVPSNLIFPWKKTVLAEEEKEKILESVIIHFPENVTNGLTFLTKGFATTTFIVLQSTFKYFLFHKTGQKDIIIGTYVSGRHIADTNNQIGSYATTNVVRTVIDNADSFTQIIEKVKKANADMVNYNAYTLIDRINDLRADNVRDPFWNINILYSDKKTGFFTNGKDVRFQTDELNLKFKAITYDKQNIIPIDFIFDFTNFKDKLVLELQYDSSLYDAKTIQELLNEYIEFTIKHVISNCIETKQY